MIYRGQTLVNLLVSMALSAFLLLVIMQFYIYIQKQNQNQLLQLELQSELQNVLQIIGKDIRRAGFNIQDPKYRVVQLSEYSSEKRNSCILFSYGIDNEDKKAKKGSEDNKLVVGYRLHEKRIEAIPHPDNKKSNVAHNEKILFSGCSLRLGWEQLIDSHRFEVTYLNFHWLIENKGLEIQLKGQLKEHKSISYETSIVVPIMNEVLWHERL